MVDWLCSISRLYFDIMQRIKCLLSHRFEFHYILVERISNLQWKTYTRAAQRTHFIRWIFIFGCSYVLYDDEDENIWIAEAVQSASIFYDGFFYLLVVRWTWPFWTVAQCVLFLFCKIMLLNPSSDVQYRTSVSLFIISDHLHTIPTSHFVRKR